MNSFRLLFLLASLLLIHGCSMDSVSFSSTTPASDNGYSTGPSNAIKINNNRSKNHSSHKVDSSKTISRAPSDANGEFEDPATGEKYHHYETKYETPSIYNGSYF